MLPSESFSLANTDIRVPSRGLGTFQADPKVYPAGSVKDSVLQALRLGCRHIDAAFAYEWGSVEREVGEAIRESGISREELFIVTKLHNCFHKPEDVAINMSMSLKNLNLDYVDLYLMHFPYAYKSTEGYGTQRTSDGKPVVDIPLSRAYGSTWAAMEKLVDTRKTRLIVQNWSDYSKQQKYTLPSTKSRSTHIFPKKVLSSFVSLRGFTLLRIARLGGALIPAITGRQGPGPLEDPTIIEISRKYHKTPAQLMLCHTICRGISVIPKTNNPKRIAENFDVLFQISENDFNTLDNLMGERGELGIRNLQTREYLGFDNFNEEIEEP
ncbi:hypothetical protein N7533_008666 [Penicillium manginii]|uniref:uncharacterized protein n=1 Tax=Penicillium manginii TaxID=203109 RepID=UPI002546CCF6|nr:uncharacterized protein N7533_008666 [Penicillium manginii]KAJ5743796.1 hypothetical protein N7533_008666 [Penicillium manginii]